MILFPSALLAARRARSEPAPAGLSLDFAQGLFSNGAVTTTSLAELPGYAFSRAGEQGAIDSDGSVDWFAADQPAINAAGFHAFGALTNLFQRSQAFDDATWGKTGVTVTANAGAAPDGTASADRVQTSARGWVQQSCPSAGGVNTVSYFARSRTAGSYAMRIRHGWEFTTDTTLLVTPVWQRFVAQRVADNGSQFALFGSLQEGVDVDVFDIDLWQGQMLGGSFPDGGPLIRTQGATGAIGASELRVGLSDGQYTATFTFDDLSEQQLPVTVADGLFHHPVRGTLTRGIVRKTVVTAA